MARRRRFQRFDLQHVFYVPAGGSTVITTETATMSMTGQPIQNRLSVPIGSVALSLTDQPIGVVTTIRIGSVALSFTGQPITVLWATVIAIGTVALSFVAHPIQIVTGGGGVGRIFSKLGIRIGVG